jgi:pyrimidine oxygenase
MDLGVFIPIGNNGWLISTTSPQYDPSFELNLDVVRRAEALGFDFALSMIKLRGFGGETGHWDRNLESFTLMAGIAAATERIRLFASTAVLTLPPALAARMATTIDSIAPGRFGVNIVTGWQPREFGQMGLWPGDDYFAHRYEYASEYVHVMKDLWATGRCDLQGEYFTMEDCRLGPLPSGEVPIICAGQSPRGMRFCAEYGDYQFIAAQGVNTPTRYAPANERLAEAAAVTGRRIASYPLFTVIAAETDKAAWERWHRYVDGADLGALAWMADQASADTVASEHSTVKQLAADGAVNFNMGTLVGSYERVAELLDEAGSVPGTDGLMLVFDDFRTGLDAFGEHVQPLMATRADRIPAAA